MDFASNLSIDQAFTNICFPNCSLQGFCLLSLSFRGQAAAILSLSAFTVQKEKAAVSLPFVFSFSPQLPVLAPHQPVFSCFALRSPSFVFSAHVKFSCTFLSSLCEASCILGLLPTMQLHASSSKLIPGISSLPLEDHFTPSYSLSVPWLADRRRALRSQPGTLENVPFPGHIRK